MLKLIAPPRKRRRDPEKNRQHQRAFHQRRNAGLGVSRCGIKYNDCVIDFLVYYGKLEPEKWDDPREIAEAISRFIIETAEIDKARR